MISKNDINGKINLAGNASTVPPRFTHAGAAVPAYENYVVNDYKTTKYGQCINRLADDAAFCRREVDMNIK